MKEEKSHNEAEQSQKASYGLEQKETYGGKHQPVPSICYCCGKASGGCCQASASRGPWAPGVHEGGLTKQLLRRSAFWSTFCLVRDGNTIFTTYRCSFFVLKWKVEIPKTKGSTDFKQSWFSWKSPLLQGSYETCIFLSFMKISFIASFCRF